MFGISPAILILLAGLGLGALAVVGFMLTRKPKSRPEPWEKAEIMKQLLALSDLEPNAVKAKPPVRPRTPAPKQTKRPAAAYSKVPARPTQQAQSKAR